MNLHIKLTDLAREKLAKLEATPQRMLAPLATAFGSATQENVGRAVKLRFTGKGPFPVSQNKLGVRTGLLRRAIRATLPQVDLNSGEISVTAGANTKYFFPHEFGYSGTVQVKGHTRRTVGGVKTNSKGKLTKQSQARLKASLQSGRAPSSYVKPHGRKLNIPARRPLGTELESIESRVVVRTRLKLAMTRILSLK